MQITIHILPTIIYSDTNAISNRCEISEFYRDSSRPVRDDIDPGFAAILIAKIY